jgi:simple sugar transport system permease protein
MTALLDRASDGPAEDDAATAATPPGRGFLRWPLLVLVGVLLLALTQQFATPETDQLTSSGTWKTALAWSVPVMLAGLGGIFAERAGIVNIGLEGMMILGTWFGAMGATLWGSWWGLAFAAVGGAIGGLLHAVATVSFGVDHIISGVAINLIAPGVTRYMADIHFTDRGGSISKSGRVERVDRLDAWLLAGGMDGPDVLGNLEDREWFFVSDLAGVLRGFVVDLSWMTLLAFALVPLSVWLLWRTRFGLRLRSCGEHPVAADSLGVNVYRYKFIGVVISGALAGLAGGYLVIELTGNYQGGQTNGRGFIGLATVIFGNWQPAGAAAGSLLFGFAETLQLRDRAAAHGLLLLAALALGVLTLWMLWRGKHRVAAAVGAASAGFALWYAFTDNVPKQLPQVLPYLVVLIVLFFLTQRLRMPAAVGEPYRRGQQ